MRSSAKLGKRAHVLLFGWCATIKANFEKAVVKHSDGIVMSINDIPRSDYIVAGDVPGFVRPLLQEIGIPFRHLQDLCDGGALKSNSLSLGRINDSVPSELIQKVADQHSLSKKDVKGVIESLASVGYKELKKNGAFLLPGFAKFVVIKKPATKERPRLTRARN
jgi:nucleoid DNA-binding protein